MDLLKLRKQLLEQDEEEEEKIVYLGSKLAEFEAIDEKFKSQWQTTYHKIPKIYAGFIWTPGLHQCKECKMRIEKIAGDIESTYDCTVVSGYYSKAKAVLDMEELMALRDKKAGKNKYFKIKDGEVELTELGRYVLNTVLNVSLKGFLGLSKDDFDKLLDNRVYINIKPYGTCFLWMVGNAASDINISPNRIDKDQAGYYEREEGFTCGQCRFLVKDKAIDTEQGVMYPCARVEGLFKAEHCCNLFEEE